MPGDVRELAGRPCEVGGGDRAVVGDHRGADRVLEGFTGLEPLAEVPAAVPDELLVRRRFGRAVDPRPVPAGGGPRGGVVDPRLHGGPLVGEDLAVAGGPIGDPGHVHGRVAPPGGAFDQWPVPGWSVVGGMGLRDEVGHLAVGSLLGGEVVEPLHGEAADVVEERRGLDEDLPVPGPSGPLPGGAVGRDVAGVVAEAPLGDAVQRVDAVVGAGEGATAGEVGVHHDCGDVVRGEGPVVPIDANVLEPLGAVSWLEDLGRVATRGHLVDLERHRPFDLGRRGEGDVVLRDITVLVQPLAVGEGRRGARGAEVAQPDPPVDVLADVDDPPPGRDLPHRRRLQLLDPPHRWCGRGGELVVTVILDPDGLPAEPGVPPARFG